MYILRLWAHCQNRKTHIFRNLTVQALKALCRFSGKAEDLEAALLGSGYIRHEDGALVVHQWDEHNATLIANWENGKKAGPPKGKSNPPAAHGQAVANPSATQGLPADNPPVTQGKPKGKSPVTHGKPMGKPRVTHGLPMDNPRVTHVTTHEEPIEERRWDGEDGEERRDGEEGDGSEPEEPPTESPEPEEPASGPAPAPLIEFPCVGAEKTWTVSPGKLAEWEAVYPDMNVLAALRRARQWCVDNPARRKTVSGMPRFIHAWLGTAQNNGENRKAGAERAPSHSPSRVPRLPTSDELYGQLRQPGEVLETNILCRM